MNGDNVIPFPRAQRDPTLFSPREQVATYVVRVDLNDAQPAIWRRLERDVRLDEVLAEVGDLLFYEYDLGDSWDHTIRLESMLARGEGSPLARCGAGARACPPEDCGGVWGYQQLLTDLADPDAADPEVRMRLQWLGEGFDPASFDVERTDELLQVTMTSALSSLLSPKGEFDESLHDLARRGEWSPTSPLALLLREAELDSVVTLSAETRDWLVKPWIRLLELVGDQGLQLTQAGYLKPDVVSLLFGELVEYESWMGRANREEHRPPVAHLRESATAMRLVRKLKGRLVLTSAGRKVTGDPVRMWDWLVSSLPLGKEDYQRHAGAVALLALSGGSQPIEGVRRHGPAILTNAGWQSSEGPVTDWMAHELARPTLDALETAVRSWGLRSTEQVEDSARQIARAALTTSNEH